MNTNFRLLLCIFCALVFFQCKESKKDNKEIVPEKPVKNPISNNGNNGDTLYHDKDFIVLGNQSRPAPDAIVYIGVKFKPYIHFDDFPVKLNRSKKAAIKYNSNPLGTEFKTRITETYNREEINFGGHYVFVEWGCGSPCEMSALVDVNSGIIYDGISSGYGYEFKKNSRMIIVNPPGYDYYLNCASCEPEIYLWDERSKK